AASSDVRRDLRQSRASPNYPDHLPCMPCSLPRWTGTGACWFLPCPRDLPRSSGGVGIHIATFEACSSFTRVTAFKVAHPPYVGFIARLRPNLFPGSDARKLSNPTNNYLSGSFPHW